MAALPTNGADDAPQGTDEQMLVRLLRETFDYFLHHEKPHNGLVPDTDRPGSPASITVIGMTISAYIVGIGYGLLTRDAAAARILRILRFFHASQQGPEADATGYNGFYYHFLDMQTGKRAWSSELSTIDTAFFIMGVLSAATYFDGTGLDESEIRRLADELYRRVDWAWACNGGATLTHGWTPERGFLPYRWDTGYNEALLLYVLAMASPTYPIGSEGYAAWTATFELKTFYDTTYIYAGPLFIHQFSHLWIDLRGRRDERARQCGFDYFENSRRATVVHRQYAIENPQNFVGYSKQCWGLTASDGPGPRTLKVDGVKREFFDYIARGAPLGPDDGTVSPWAVVASLPFAPDLVLCTIRHAIERLKLKHRRLYGFDASFNPTFPDKSRNQQGWVSPWRFGLNQGPIVLMIGNYQRETLWRLMQRCPYIELGLQRAGFQ